MITEDQIFQRIEKIQNRIFSDINQSKLNTSQSLEVTGSNGISVQNQGNKISLSFDSNATSDVSGLGGTSVDSASGTNGAEGPQGPQGVSVTNAQVDESYNLIITLSDGTTINAGKVFNVPQGDGVLGVASGSLFLYQTTDC